MSNEKRLTYLWLLLMGITLGSAWIAESAEPSLLVTLAIAMAVAYKGCMIVDHFMGLKHANPVLRRLMIVYFYVIPSMIVLVYLFSERIAAWTSLT